MPAAVSIRGNRLVLFHRPQARVRVGGRDEMQIGPQEVVECRRADTGESVWSFAYPSSFLDPYGYNSGPRCTQAAPITANTNCTAREVRNVRWEK